MRSRAMQGIRPVDAVLAVLLCVIAAVLAVGNIRSTGAVTRIDSHSWLQLPVFVATMVPVLWWRRSLIAADHFDARKPEVLSETLNNLHDVWHKHDPTLNLRSLTFSGSRHDPAQYLAKRGWITRNRDLPDLFRAANRPAPAAADLPAAAKSFRFLSGIRN